MLKLHCTRKAATFLPTPSPPDEGPGEEVHWHLNLIYLQGRQSLLYMHDASRFVILDRAVKKSEAHFFQRRFIRLLAEAVSDLGGSDACIDTLIRRHRLMHWDTHTQRSVLGSLNITRRDILAILEQDIMSVNIRHVHKVMNQRPMTVNQDYVFPHEEFLKLVVQP